LEDKISPIIDAAVMIVPNKPEQSREAMDEKKSISEQSQEEAEINWKEMISNNTLKTLKVPILKDYCNTHGLVTHGSKKTLLRRITTHVTDPSSLPPDSKVTIKQDIPPAIYGFNGSQFIEDSKGWLTEFKNALESLKKIYAKQRQEGLMSVYPRPTYKADITSLCKAQFEEAKIILS